MSARGDARLPLLIVVFLAAAGLHLLTCPAIAQQTGSSEYSALRKQLDAYGGLTTVTCPSKSKAHFYTEKIGNRWWLCTPAGHGFFLKGVYGVNYNDSSPDYQGVALTDLLNKKYAKGVSTFWPANWALQSVRRLKDWGFNTLSEYSSLYTWPTTVDAGSWNTSDHAIPERMPFVVIVRPSFYTLTNSSNRAKGPVKDLLNGVTKAAYAGYRSHITDVFDSNFGQWLLGELRNDYSIHSAISGPHNDYLLGFDIDESDNTQGLRAGPDFPTVNDSFTGAMETGHTMPHMGWMVLATAATQSSNSSLGQTYSDTTVYSKKELGTWLAARYNNNIAALNTAWGSKYTSFGSAGGSGVLDENGQCPSRGASACWVGDPFTLVGETATMQTDMNAFLSHYLDQYYSTIKKAFNSAAPGYLLTEEIGGWGAPPRKEVLQVAQKYLDLYTFEEIPPFLCAACTDVQKRVDFAAQYGGDKPWLNWEGFTAQPDSYWSQTTRFNGLLATQQQRGQYYQQMFDGLLNTKDSGGTYHIVGFQWWDFYDMRSEQTSWGLLTRRDNAYDGVQSTPTAGTDAWGYPTGGERTRYGDFLTAVRNANWTKVPPSK